MARRIASLLRNQWTSRILGACAAILLAWWLHGIVNSPLPGAHVFTPFDNVRLPLQRTTPDGTAYKVDPGRAVFALDMADEDAASRRVFPSYAAALRHARELGLPTMPSVPLVLAAGRALEARLQMALERRLELGDDGRPALIRRWSTLVLAQRAVSSEALRPAYDRAARHLADALALDEGVAGSDTALGPWGEDEDLRRIWRRDRHLADALVVEDESSAAAAALLARTLADDATLSAGWARQAAVARAWAGAPGGTTFEELAPVLADVADADLAATVRTAVARRPRPDRRACVAPASLAWVMTPEEQVLAPLGMAAWDDPLAALVTAIDSGDLDLAPAADAGFYRRRWYALETLAAPRLAPEAQKLQLTADYLRRWRRAFAAGFSEGRSGLVKRLPEICAGISEPGPVPVDIAPQFTAEPAPIVYLRLGRAYRALAADLQRSLGAGAWQSLRDAGGAPLAAAVAARADLCFGLGAAVSAELGFPLKPTEAEAGLDVQASLTAARQWAAASADDSDVAADARLLVTLAQDGEGLHRCPAILGVRLEPVIYRWVEEPDVSGNVRPAFVPARYWLPSPCPATVTVTTVPDPPAFRARCDGHAEVAPLFAAFGQYAPALRETQRPWWPWLIAGFIMAAALNMARIGWRRLPGGGRARLAISGLASLAALLGWLAWFPPYAVVRFAATDVVTAHPNIAVICRHAFGRWSFDHRQRLFVDLVSDPDPQVRYLAAWLPIYLGKADFPGAFDVLRQASSDSVPEVAWLAWHYRCVSSEPAASLLADLERTTSSEQLFQRMLALQQRRQPDAELSDSLLRLADAPDDDRRAAVHRP